MNAKSIRLRRLLLQELAPIIQKRFPANAQDGLVTLTDVSMSPDAASAKVFISVFQSKQPSDTWQRIENETKAIRHALAGRIRHKVRQIPTLWLCQDHGQQNAEHMHKILNNLNIPPTDNS